MSRIEIYAKLRLATAQLDALRHAASAVVEAAREQPGCIRCDWFLQAERGEAIAMLVYRDAAALRAHRSASAAASRALQGLGTLSIEFLGEPPAQALAELQSHAPSVMQFSSGIDALSGAHRFTRPDAASGLPSRNTSHIEIYTRFEIHREYLAQFKAGAGELLELVKRGDPATSRYDWFFDDARLACVAMDTYADPSGMFAHMKNCHDAHAKLLQWSVMVTEFLGALPPEAAQAVAKYNPYVAPFMVGLQAHSSGGI